MDILTFNLNQILLERLKINKNYNIYVEYDNNIKNMDIILIQDDCFNISKLSFLKSKYKSANIIFLYEQDFDIDIEFCNDNNISLIKFNYYDKIMSKVDYLSTINKTDVYNKHFLYNQFILNDKALIHYQNNKFVLNKTFFALLKENRDEIIEVSYNSFLNYIYDKDISLFNDTLSLVEEGKKEKSIELRIVNFGKVIIWVNIFIYIYDKNIHLSFYNISKYKNKEYKLEIKNEKLNLIVNNMPVLLSYFNELDECQYINQNFLNYFNIDKEYYNNSLKELLPLRIYKDFFRNIIILKKSNNQQFNFEYHDKEKNQYFEVSLVKEKEKYNYGYYIILSDISERKINEQKIMEINNKFEQLANNIPEIFFLFDLKEKKVEYINKAYTDIFGDDIEEVIKDNNSWFKYIKLEYRDNIIMELSNTVKERKNKIFSFPIIDKKKIEKWIETKLFLVNKSGEEKYVGIIEDITNSKINEEKLKELALFDNLTKLPNRYYFQEKLHNSIKQNTEFSLIFFDLNKFKDINDTLGHHFGDELLIQVGKRIKSIIKKEDFIARLGGDEFAVIVKEPDETIINISEKIIKSLTDKFVIEKREVYIGGSLGITFYPHDALTSEELLKNADMAMYKAKDNNKSNYQFFTNEMKKNIVNRLSYIEYVRHETKNNQLIFETTEIKNKKNNITKYLCNIKDKYDKFNFNNYKDIERIITNFELIEEVIHTLINDINNNMEKEKRCIIVKLHNQLFKKEIINLFINNVKNKNDIMFKIDENTIIDYKNEELLKNIFNNNIEIIIDKCSLNFQIILFCKKNNIQYIKIDNNIIENINDDNKELFKNFIDMANKINIKIIADKNQKYFNDSCFIIEKK